MWAEIRKAPNLMIAEMWKEFFEGEGIPSRVLPEGPGVGERVGYRVLVPRDKQHIIEEILKKV